VNDFDRQLVDLISTLTDEGQVVLLRDVAEDYGKELVTAVVEDGFAVVANTFDDFHFQVLVSTDNALRLLGDSASECVIGQARGAIALEDEPNLIFRYAAGDPDAIAEVRSRHGRE
jgi:hypothetical protein